MKLPRFIKAAPLTYKVVEDDAYLDAICPKDEKCLGLCEPDREQVTIRRLVSDGMRRLSLFHESLHIAWHEVLADDENEERIVEALDSPLLALFDRNPALRRALWGEKN